MTMSTTEPTEESVRSEVASQLTRAAALYGGTQLPK
jgi:hypothetical protein